MGARPMPESTPAPEATAPTSPAAADRLEIAPSGRAGCRACGAKIARGDWRFGEVLPASHGAGEGTASFWFHLRCAALRRPDKLAALLQSADAPPGVPDRDRLLAEAEQGLAAPRLARIAGAERASSGRARCRQCQQLIEAGSWRLRLSSFGETGFFDPLGFVHAGCARAYLQTAAPLAERLRAVAPELDDAALEEICQLVDAPPPGPEPAA
jgi:hypothetical protein